uniref:SRPBCC domain-containing protein n=1 Tax=Enterococcus lactis TaxID=357441 RepID=UPI0034E937DF
MSDATTLDTYGALIEPATLRIQRILPGPIERIWRYLTDGRLRRQWLAVGEMEMRIGSALELVWRNDELSDQPTTRPAGFAAEMRMESRVTELDPPR